MSNYDSVAIIFEHLGSLSEEEHIATELAAIETLERTLYAPVPGNQSPRVSKPEYKALSRLLPQLKLRNGKAARRLGVVLAA